MATHCIKCGREVDTLAKRRHSCVKVKVNVFVNSHRQLVFDCLGRSRKPFNRNGE